MISFIIPTRNEGKGLRDTLQSLCAYRGEYEIIVSDGASSDDTVAIARELCREVVLYDQPVRQTIGQGRNAGAAVARGEFLVFLDADVRIPDMNAFFKRALGRFAADPKLMGLTGYYRVWPAMATLADRVIFQLLGDYFALLNWLGIGASGGEFQMVRAEAFRRVGGYNEKLAAAEDMDLFGRLAKLGRTRLDRGLSIYHSGRRARQIGWPRLLWQWSSNCVSMWLFNKSLAHEWVEVR